MNIFKRLFGRKPKKEVIPRPEFSQEQYDLDYEKKEKALEVVLGKMYGMVGHAIIPFEIGGAVDMYYFPNHIVGTGFATMELLDPSGNGPMPNRQGTYELVAFTKKKFNTSEGEQTAFNLIERRICSTFTAVGNYSFQAILMPGETCEIPFEGEENRCLILDNYRPENKEFIIGDRRHHLLLCLEVFPSEMEYARKNGSEELLSRMKEAGYYPYSDLDRLPLV